MRQITSIDKRVRNWHPAYVFFFLFSHFLFLFSSYFFSYFILFRPSIHFPCFSPFSPFFSYLKISRSFRVLPPNFLLSLFFLLSSFPKLTEKKTIEKKRYYNRLQFDTKTKTKRRIGKLKEKRAEREREMYNIENEK